MPVEWRYRGRAVTPRTSFSYGSSSPTILPVSRRKLSAQLCEAWQWKQANGALCDMVCRGLLLMLHRAGEIELPPVRQISLNPFVRARAARSRCLSTDAADRRSERTQAHRYPAGEANGDEPLFNSLMEHHHYLGYEQPVGEHLKYLVWAHGRPIACLAWSSAPRHLGSRDRYIGWNARSAAAQHPLLAYNTRFLILPWIGCRIWRRTFGPAWPRGCRTIGKRMYGHPIYFSGNLHRSGAISRHLLSGGQLGILGRTTGRGKERPTHRAEPFDQRSAGISPDAAVPAVTGGDGRMQPPRANRRFQ